MKSGVLIWLLDQCWSGYVVKPLSCICRIEALPVSGRAGDVVGCVVSDVAVHQVGQRLPPNLNLLQ